MFGPSQQVLHGAATNRRATARRMFLLPGATPAGLSVVASFITCQQPFDMADKYYIKPQQSNWRRWEWEIYRNGEPMAVRLRGGNHSSKSSAERAGARALREFLRALERERNAE